MGNGSGTGQGGGGDKVTWDEEVVTFEGGNELVLREQTVAQGFKNAINAGAFRLSFHNKIISALPSNNTTACPKDPNPVFTSKDLEWDNNGCLTIKDNHLGKKVSDAKEAGPIMISYWEPGPGGIGGNKTNGLCYC
jgi:hypothetical protein